VRSLHLCYPPPQSHTGDKWWCPQSGHCKHITRKWTTYPPKTGPVHHKHIKDFPSQFDCSVPSTLNAQYIHSVPSDVIVMFWLGNLWVHPEFPERKYLWCAWVAHWKKMVSTFTMYQVMWPGGPKREHLGNTLNFPKESTPHWGQGLVYWVSKLQANCKQMEKKPTQLPTWQLLIKFTIYWANLPAVCWVQQIVSNFIVYWVGLLIRSSMGKFTIYRSNLLAIYWAVRLKSIFLVYLMVWLQFTEPSMFMVCWVMWLVVCWVR